MNNASRVNVVVLIGCMLLLTTAGGCGSGFGKARAVTMVAPVDIENCSAVYVEDVNVSSEEQNEKTEKSNARYAQYTQEQIDAALQELNRFDVLDEKRMTSDSLVLQTNIHIVYGNQALRYVVTGYLAGEGRINVTMKLVDPLTNKIKMEVYSNSELTIGLFGGSMDSVIENNIQEVIEEFFSQLQRPVST